MPDYVIGEDGQLIPAPKAPEPVEEEVEEAPRLRGDSLSDMFEVPQPEDNDMQIDHLFELPQDDNLSDLTNVSNEDVISGPPRKTRYRSTRKARRYTQMPPSSMGGVQY